MHRWIVQGESQVNVFVPYTNIYVWDVPFLPTTLRLSSVSRRVGGIPYASYLVVLVLCYSSNSWIESFHGSELAEVSLCLGHFVPVALHHLISFSGGT